jgi:serine/threonine-protein kinase
LGTIVDTPHHTAVPPAGKAASWDTEFSVAPRSASRPDPHEFATVAAVPDDSASLDTFVEPVEGPEVPGFEILSELGRGGMGIVYKARQLSADRLVALKVVRNDVLETLPLASRASTLERFQQEAQAAAKLEHDNLVTVFEVGTANGMRYYAMRYVEGRSLYDLLRDGPLDNRRAAGYLEPVCRGLHYAHQRGILHRDLKPHNILVDQTLDRPLVADFGLAKFLERRDELTHAGEVMGTPSYMPPEQALNAASVTASADVYSLGATLYHVLTLRPPFQAANVAETIRQIIDVDPVSPRQVNPAIDRDLETICLKCLQKEPARRYGSAELLADDLQRYLDGEPILARPIGTLARTWRWCRRKPVQAGLIATAATFALVSLVAIVVGYRNTAAALAESESRLQKALQVVDDLFTRVSEDELLNEPGMQPLRKDLLARALKHYQYFLEESGGNPAIQDEVAAARFRVGLITQVTGSRETARKEFLAARAMQQDLLNKRPEDPSRLRSLADTLNALGSLYKEMDVLDEATAMYTEAATLRTRLANLDPANDEFQRLLANVRMNLGQVEMSRNRNTQAREHLLFAQDLRRKLVEANPKARRDLAMGFYNLGKLAMVDQQDPDAARYFRDAIQQFELLLKQDARSLANRYYLAVCYRQLAALQADAGDVSSALANFEAARLGMESLAIGNPDVVFYQTELANLTMNVAGLYYDRDDRPAASRAWKQVLATVEGLLRRDPRNPDYRRDKAIALSTLGSLHLKNGENDAAAEKLGIARDGLRQLLTEFPNDEYAQGALDETLADLATLAAGPKGPGP